MARCQERLAGRATHELLQAQVEVDTRVCPGIAGVRRELTELRAAVARTAQDFGMALIAASTHPFANWRAQKKVEKERYAVLARDMQTLAARLVICGMHIHAGIEDEELRIDLMNQATYFLPHLLALSTSSPFWEGHATGLKAYRPTIFGDLPRSGLPEYFASADEWHHMLRLLAQTGLCDDATKIWWDIRPSVRFPTLELRICDVCTRLEDALTIAALWQSILATLYRLRARQPDLAALPAHPGRGEQVAGPAPWHRRHARRLGALDLQAVRRPARGADPAGPPRGRAPGLP